MVYYDSRGAYVINNKCTKSIKESELGQRQWNHRNIKVKPKELGQTLR